VGSLLTLSGDRPADPLRDPHSRLPEEPDLRGRVVIRKAPVQGQPRPGVAALSGRATVAGQDVGRRPLDSTPQGTYLPVATRRPSPRRDGGTPRSPAR